MRFISFKKVLGGLFVFFVPALLAGWLYSRQTLFRFSDFKVVGAEELSKSSIEQILARSLGTPLFRVGLEKLEREVSAVGAFESVSLKKQWPSTIVVQVVERRPLVMSFRGGVLWGLDAQGWLLPLKRAIDLPLLTKGKERELPENFVQEKSFEMIMKFFSELTKKGTELFFEIDEIEIEADGSALVKILSRGLDVYLGKHQILDAWSRFQTAQNFVKENSLDVRQFDASSPQRVILTLQNPESEINLKQLVRRTEPEPSSAAR